MSDAKEPSREELHQEIHLLQAQVAALRANLKQNALLEQEADRFPSVLETMSEGLMILNKEDQLVFVNKAFCRTLGYEPSEIIGRPAREYVVREHVGIFDEAMAQGRSGHRDRHEMTLVGKWGRKVQVLVSPAPIFDEDRRYCGVLALMLDMTEHKSVLEELTHEHRLLRTLMDQLPDEVYVKDNMGRYVAANHAKVRRSNRGTEEDLLGRTAFDLYPPELARRLDAYDQQVLTRGEAILNAVDQWERANGSTEWTLTSKAPLRDSTGDIVGIIGITRDVTETRRVAEALNAASRMEATATLAGGIAHEFNNLMSIVLLNAELLGLEVEGNLSAQSLLETISRAADQAARMAQQMLAFARGGRYRLEKVHLNELVDRIVHLERSANPPGIRITTHYAPGLWAVMADVSQMEQIVISLLNNAMEAITGEGQVRCVTENRVVEGVQEKYPGMKPGDYVVLSVQDTGPGMPSEVLARAFEPFFTTKFQGRGLGLAAAYGIVKNHQGFIYASNRPPGGARFEVFLPAFAETGAGMPPQL